MKNLFSHDPLKRKEIPDWFLPDIPRPDKTDAKTKQLLYKRCILNACSTKLAASTSNCDSKSCDFDNASTELHSVTLCHNTLIRGCQQKISFHWNTFQKFPCHLNLELRILYKKSTRIFLNKQLLNNKVDIEAFDFEATDELQIEVKYLGQNLFISTVQMTIF